MTSRDVEWLLQILLRAEIILDFLADYELPPPVREETQILVDQVALAAQSGDVAILARAVDGIEVLDVTRMVRALPAERRSFGIAPLDVGPAMRAIVELKTDMPSSREWAGGVAGGDAPEPPRHPTIRRTPHLRAGEPGEDRRFDVKVYLDTTPPDPGEIGDFEIDEPTLAEKASVEVWLRGSDHFVIDPAQNPQTITFDTGMDLPSTIARFIVKMATGDATDLVPLLTATFLYRNRPCGAVHRRFDRAEAAAPAQGEACGDGGGAVRLDREAAAPDLRVTIEKHPERPHLYVVTVDSLLCGGIHEQAAWDLPTSAEAWASAEVEKLLDIRMAEGDGLLQELRGVGRALFSESPASFQTAYWTLAAQGLAPASLLVISEESAIAWELMTPHRANTPMRDLRALGTTCAIGRWPPAPSDNPKAEVTTTPFERCVPLADCIVVAPTYNGNALPNGPAEAKLVLERYQGSLLDPKTVDELDQYFDNRSASLLHFICHGLAMQGGHQSIQLGERELSVQQLEGSTLVDACGRTHPLVFLNACDVGGAAPGLRRADGFGPAFVRSGARCVIAPLWPADDKVAFEFATAFYDALSEQPDTPIAAVLSRLRARAYEPGGEDTWAAYCFYGDPLAMAYTDAGLDAPATGEAAARHKD